MMDSYDSYLRRRSDDEFYRHMLNRNLGGMVRESASSEACLHYLDCLNNPENSETGDSPQTDYSTDDPAWRDAEYLLIIENNNARSVIEESDLLAPLKDTLRAFVDSLARSLVLARRIRSRHLKPAAFRSSQSLHSVDSERGPSCCEAAS